MLCEFGDFPIAGDVTYQISECTHPEGAGDTRMIDAEKLLAPIAPVTDFAIMATTGF